MVRFVNDGIILLSLGIGAPPMLPQGEIPVSFADKEGAFNKDLAERYIQNGLRRSVGEFADAQVDEYLAARMRELIALDGQRERSRSLGRLRPRERQREDQVRPILACVLRSDQKPPISEAALGAWIADNEDRLDAEYEANKHRYTNLEKQVRARHILVKAGSRTPPRSSKSGGQEDAPRRLQKRAAKGEDFAELASENSDDPVTAKNGGDIGFLRKGAMPDAFDEALFSMKVDEISEVVETPTASTSSRSSAIREGDVPVDEAKQRACRRPLPGGLARSACARRRGEHAALPGAADRERRRGRAKALGRGRRRAANRP